MISESGSYFDAGGVDSAGVDDVEALRLIVEGTAAGTGKAFFDALVCHMAAALGTGYAFVAEFLGGGRARTLAYWKKTQMHPEPVEWDVVGTPCEDVVKGTLRHRPEGVANRFPADEPMVRGARSPRRRGR